MSDAILFGIAVFLGLMLLVSLWAGARRERQWQQWTRGGRTLPLYELGRGRAPWWKRLVWRVWP